MFCVQALNIRFNRTYKRALKIIYENYESSFEELLSNDSSVTIHQRTLRSLAVDMYRVTYKLSPESMWDIRYLLNTTQGQAVIYRKIPNTSPRI